MIGIYLIRNKINGHCYIGQSMDIARRWRSHRNSAENNENSPLYRAMRKYGTKNFKIYEIDRCDYFSLPEREKYWISFYNTYKNKKNGYNQTPGGECCGNRKYNEELIIETYKRFGTLTKTSKLLNLDVGLIRKILLKNGIKIKESAEMQREKAFKISAYDENKKLIKTFTGTNDCAKWILDNYPERTVMKEYYRASISILSAITTHHKAFGFYWINETKNENINYIYDLINKREKLFSNVGNYKLYKNNKLIICSKNIGEIYKYILSNSKEKIGNKDYMGNTIKNAIIENKKAYGFKFDFEILQKENKIKSKKPKEYKIKEKTKRKNIKKLNVCPKCNNMKGINANLCLICSQKEAAKNIPSREILKNLIRTKSFLEIASIYNVFDNAIKKWCIKYNLPHRKKEINQISDEDWKNENWDLTNLPKVIKPHKNIIPKYDEFKQDLFNLSKIEIAKKYDFADPKIVDKFAKQYNIPYNHYEIIKFSPEEWEQEKWKDSNFINNVLPNRYIYKYPEFNEFKEIVYKNNFTNIATQYKTTTAFVYSMLKYFGLPETAEKIKSYTYEEWMALPNKQSKK